MSVNNMLNGFQSTPLMRGETGMSPATVSRSIRISIHSPHARGDFFFVK